MPMILEHIPLNQIVANPWRDLDLYPIDQEQLTELRDSIKEHGNFQHPKGRRRNGKVEIACGHRRLAAERKNRAETLAVYIEDMDDDTMLRLMTDENATQAGSHPGAVLNEVAAVLRRLIGGLLTVNTGGDIATNVAMSIKQAFEDKRALEIAYGRLKALATNPDAAKVPIGEKTIIRYLGKGDPDKCKRGERQIREAISALKQSGRYDEIIDAELRKYPQPVPDAPAPRSRDVTPAQEPRPKKKILDERVANLFPNEHQFHAFREAVTTPAAQRVIPVNQQHALARKIMDTRLNATGRERFKTKQIGAPFIKMMVSETVKDALKAQREINEQERRDYERQQLAERLQAELYTAGASLRSLLSSLMKLERMVEQNPEMVAHPIMGPKLGGFSERMDLLTDAIKKLADRLRPRPASANRRENQ